MRWIGLSLIGLIAISSPARANESPTHELAKKHYELGNTYYQVSNYKEALAEFEKAYELEPLPGLVFNIARCHEVMGNLNQAIAKYKLFLEKSPNSSERSTIELRIKNLEARRREQTPPPTNPPPVPTPTPATQTPAPDQAAPSESVTPPPEKPEVQSSRTWRWPVGWAVVSVGGAALITGVIFGTMVASKSDEYTQAGAEGKTYATLNDIRSTADTYHKVELATLVVGGLALAAGGGLLIWELLGHRESPAPRTSFLPFVGPGGLGFNLSSRF